MTDNSRPSSDDFAFDSLESIRKKLLDLSSRNSLLNYKHPKAASLRLINALPDQLSALLKDNKKLAFVPVPEPTEQELIEAGYIEVDLNTSKKKEIGYPTAEQWAKYLGYSTSYSLPTPKNDITEKNENYNTRLQTLLYPAELEARLRNIRGKAETAMQESGANIGYIALGFLEWYESKSSSTKRLAPLFTIPIYLKQQKYDRGEGIYRYTINLKDDGLLTNVTLKEKLKLDFDLALPEIDENISPEEYFTKVQKTILKHKATWVLQRNASLVLLNFTKQAMYQDLDPRQWPDGLSIEQHPIIKQFFSSNGQELDTNSLNYTDEYAIDDIDRIHEQYPLVYDADSSQHSALIDAVNGENLVIEGPPGSGKSQTITNLIAACLANGKNVLFVAEKMAALNVVKNRLDHAGLGDFCLELHSHKTNKQKILGDLSRRLNKQNEFSTPQSFERDIERYENLKKKLQSYQKVINNRWCQTGLTIHEILNKAVRYRNKFDINPERYSIKDITGENFTELKQSELFDQIDMFCQIFERISSISPNSDISQHYWYGINNLDILDYQVKTLYRTLSDWTDSLKELRNLWNESISKLNFESYDDLNLSMLSSHIEDGLKLPELEGDELINKLPYFIKNVSEFSSFISDYEYIHKQFNHLEDIFSKEVLENNNTVSNIQLVLTKASEINLPGEAGLDLIKSLNNAFTNIISIVKEVEENFTRISPNIPSDLQGAFMVSKEGLYEFKTIVKLLNLLPKELWSSRDSMYDNDDLDNFLDNFSEYVSRIKVLSKELSPVFVLEDLPSSATLKKHESVLKNDSFIRFLSSAWRDSKKSILSLAVTPKSNIAKLNSNLPKLIEFVETEQNIQKLIQEHPVIEKLYFGVDTPIEKIISLREWYKQVREEYGSGFGKRVSIGSAVLSLDRNIVASLLEERELLVKVSEASNLLYELESKINKPIINTNTPFLSSDSPLQKYQSLLIHLKQGLEEVVINSACTLDEINTAALNLKKVYECINRWQESIVTKYLIPECLELSVLPGNYEPDKLEILKRTYFIVKVITDAPLMSPAFSYDIDVNRYNMIFNFFSDINELYKKSDELKQKFIELGRLNSDQWAGYQKESIDLVNIDKLIIRNNLALENKNTLAEWLGYIRIKNDLTKLNLNVFINDLENKKLQLHQLSDAIKLVIYNQLAREILSQNKALSAFSGMEHISIAQKFRDYDKKILELQKQKIAFSASRAEPPMGVATGKVSNYSETALIKHEVGKKTRHIAVRNLLNRAGTAIKALKPCFMMSPMSVAQYLEPGQFNFDIVIMDEASQIRPEDAIGAIARGVSVVIVGDPKQLPPTNFFHRNLDNDDEDAVALEESESILESVIPIFRTRRLRWHYRSRHESLIAFSNQHFYDSNLVLFPSPFQESREYGIRFYKVSKGKFVNRRNIEEARSIVQLVQKQLIQSPDESVGVVAMNSEQREEIEKQFEQLKKDNDELQNYFESHQESNEPLFIKNLENVQGDERDIIIISMTYGPERVGSRTMQRFGPVNTNVGWRRLNVLFTRSKKRMHVFSSMGSGDIIISNTSKRGVQALKAFLEYCESGHLHNSVHTGRTVESDFEFSVMHALSEHGYECEPQLGVAGYFLDLAVKDPGKPGSFLMGIECDGATYHSAKSSRDRDRLRQEILEGLGWNIYRIWSTDWFKNSQAQIEIIIRQLDAMKTKIDESKSDNIQFGDNEVALSSSRLGSEAINNKFTDIQSSAFNEESDSMALKDRLLQFNETVIRPKFPDISLENQLLRPAMIEALINHLPCSKAEFLESIPQYLRKNIASEEGQYLEDVLQLVVNYGY